MNRKHDTHNTVDPPLVTFAIIAFNQEEYIREAIEGAFSQTYTPLEIVISDDCSTDRTYEIICELAEAYQGNHIIRTHRPEKNLGIGQHVNKIGELSRGEFVLLAGGDDISAPNRTETLVRAWLDSDRKACSIYSNMSVIDKDGNVTKPLYNSTGTGIHAEMLEDVIANETAGLYGCTQGVDGRVFSSFEPMKKGVLHEDEVLPFRALLLGNIAYINEPLVQYRRHETNEWGKKPEFSSIRDAKEWNKKRAKHQLAHRQTWCRDLAAIAQENEGQSPLAPKFDQLVALKQTELEMCDQNIVVALLKTLQLMATGAGVGRSLKIFRRIKLFPVYSILREKLFTDQPRRL